MEAKYLLTCVEFAAAVGMHQRTARQVIDEALARAEKFQDKFRPFITLTPELAREQASRVDAMLGAGKTLPLAGVPFGVKDLIDVKGVPTTAGSKVVADASPASDAACIRRLMAAGAIPIGKTNLHEWAFGFTGENPHFGDCRNPWNPDRIAGGSSSGSAAAVALSICPMTLGSDTGGSIRHPAALCGVTGLKPTYGRVSRQGVAALAWTLDHVGPLAHTAEDCALVLKAMAGRDPTDESSSRRPVPEYLVEIKKPIDKLQVGVPQSWFYDGLDPAVAAAVEAATSTLFKLGAKRRDVDLTYLREVVGAHRAIIFPEAASYHQTNLETRADEYGPDIRPLLQAGLYMPSVDYLKAQRLRRIVRKAWAKVFASVDCLAVPTSPIVATKFGQQSTNAGGRERPLVRAYLDFTLPFNFSGHPAISVPCGFSEEKLPIGLQLVGRPFDEATILRLAHHYQQATDWHKRTAPAAAR